MATRTIDGITYQAVVFPEGYDGITLDGATIEIGASVEVSNDAGNPLPVSDAGGSITIDDGGGSITVDGPLTDTQLRASAVSVAPNVTRGGGAMDANTTRVTLATDGPTVSALTSIDTKTPALQSGASPVGDNGSSLTVDGKSYASSVSITRPANVTPYTAGDVVGTTSTAIHQLSSAGPSGGFVILQSLDLLLQLGAVPSGMSGFRVHFYSASPTAIADNAVFNLVAADRASYLGYADLGTPADLGDTCWAQADFTGRQIKLATGQTTIWCQLQTIGAYTPAANSEVYELRARFLEAGL